MPRPKDAIRESVESFPPLPLEPAHWKAVFKAMHLSAQQAKLIEFLLRGMCDKQIAEAMHISEPTIRTYLDRIWTRTGTRGRMELAMRVLDVSHQVDRAGGCPQK